MSDSWSQFSGLERRYIINNYPDDKLKALGRSIMELPSFLAICDKVGVVWHMNTGIVSRLTDGQQAGPVAVSDYVYELWMDPGCREAFERHEVVVTDLWTGKPAVNPSELTPEDLQPKDNPRMLQRLLGLLPPLAEGEEEDPWIDDEDDDFDDNFDDDGLIPMVGVARDYSLEAIAALLAKGEDDAEVETPEET